jgi:Lysophospholipase
MPVRKLINTFLAASLALQASACLATEVTDNSATEASEKQTTNKKNAEKSSENKSDKTGEQKSAESDKKDKTKASTDKASGSKKFHVPTKAPIDAPSVSWLPPGDVKPKVALLCIHGFTLHKNCFAAFGKEMAKDGIATYAMDMRGFGELMDKKKERTELDFDGCLVDIKAMLEKIHKNHPGVPVILLGESMGGAIALRATALYPDLISGLISCVPARDRSGMSSSELKTGVVAGIRTIFGGFRKPMDHVALSAVQKISEKEEVRKEWKNDPLMRTSFSPKEFLQFDEFMSENLDVAAHVKDTPVLFIQGTNDKLIRPAGTWKLYENLATANRQLVLSKNSEHLIFEEGQFRPDDLEFVATWINRNITPLDSSVVGTKDKLPTVASVEEYSKDASTTKTETLADGKSDSTTASASTSESNAEIATLPPPPPVTEFKNRIATDGPPQINYWIELNRGGKTYRCNNKMEFKSGDSIRFHLIPESDGFAYLVMKAGTTGKSDVLFPNKAYGTNNYLRRGQDYPIPAEGWMQFDNHPGTEQLGLMFAHNKVDINPNSLQNRTMTAFVSPHMDGAKDLCPTRMKLSWDDSNPVIIPDDFEAISQVSSKDSSLVRLRSMSGGMVSASIQLLHGK